MAKTFTKVHASIVGKFENGIGEKIPQWIRANGGQFSRNVDGRVTHLIATKEAFKQRAGLVEAAKSISTIKIVSYDWLEDSLQSPTRKPKPEGPYLLKNLMVTGKESKKKDSNNSKTANEAKNDKRNGPKRRIADPFLGPKGKRKPVRRVYQERETNVVYSVTLFRTSKPPATSREKYQLTIFESIAEPHTYSTYTKFSRVGTSNVDLLVGPRGKLESAVEKFKQFFKEQTGKDWDERSNGQMPPHKRDVNGNSLPVHEGWFYLEEKSTLLGAYLRESQNRLELEADERRRAQVKKAQEERAAKEKRIAEEAERDRIAKEEAEAAQAAHGKAEEEDRKRKEAEQKRAKQAEDDRVKRMEVERARIAKARREREAAEQRRREALPSRLRVAADLVGSNNPRAKSHDWLKAFMPLVTAQSRQLDPGCGVDVADEKLIPNYLVAPLLATNDLTFIPSVSMFFSTFGSFLFLAHETWLPGYLNILLSALNGAWLFYLS